MSDAHDLDASFDEEMFPHQRAFLLMQLFCAKGDALSLTRSELLEKLRTETAKKTLLFARMSTDPVVNPDPTMVDWALERLVSSKDIVKQPRGRGARYTLADRGQGTLAASEQYPSFEFRLTGKQFNSFVEAIRVTGPATRTAFEVTEERPVQQPGANAPASSPLTTVEILDAFEELRNEQFARNGIVPVYELRRLLAERHGAVAASHDILDPMLKRLRRENRVRMIAIGDLSSATKDQLEDSVHGENETFFSLEISDAYAHAR